MEVATRIALLLFGLGVGDILAEQPTVVAERDSPIFVVRPPLPPPPAGPPKSPVQQQLASLLRSEIGPMPTPATATETLESDREAAENEQLLKLEKMTVKAPRLPSPAVRESAFEKFTRTGYIWEFSPTKRFMIGPKGDKVGVMFSFDW